MKVKSLIVTVRRGGILKLYKETIMKLAVQGGEVYSLFAETPTLIHGCNLRGVLRLFRITSFSFLKLHRHMYTVCEQSSYTLQKREHYKVKKENLVHSMCVG